MSEDNTVRLNVRSDAPRVVFRAPNENPEFNTDSKDVSTGASGDTVVNAGSIDVTTGGQGQPISNGG